MINTDKIIKELEKGDSDEMLVALEVIKFKIIEKLTEEQNQADELASKRQTQIERIKVSN